MRKKNYIVTVLLILLFFPVLSKAAEPIGGGDKSRLLDGLGTTVENANLGVKDVVKNPPATAPQLIGKIIEIVLSFLGVIFLVLMVYGGYLWMTGGGNEEQIAKAKNIMVAAIIGLIIVLAAYIIVNTLAGLLAKKTELTK